MPQPLAARAIPRLVVILQKYQQSLGRCLVRRLGQAARLVIREFPREHKSFGQRLADLTRRAKISIVPLPLAGQPRVQRIMKIVVPLRVETVAACFARHRQARDIRVALGDYISRPAKGFGPLVHGHPRHLHRLLEHEGQRAEPMSAERGRFSVESSSSTNRAGIVPESAHQKSAK